MNQDKSCLVDTVRNDPSTRPPFFWHHIRPEAQQWGILEIWRNAGPATKPFFDLGRYPYNGAEYYGPNANWVTAWLLYSVFRSRDVRNNRNRRRDQQQQQRQHHARFTYAPIEQYAPSSSGFISASQHQYQYGYQQQQEAALRDVAKRYYDPVRNG